MSGMYARDTSVSVERSRAEIETVLARYGATAFAYMTDIGRAVIGFRIADTDGVVLAVRMTLPLPDKADRAFTHRKRYQEEVENDLAAQNKLWEQACRSSWRSLCLVIKAKLEACAAGISTIEREFMPDIVLSNGKTMLETLRPQMKEITQNGTLPKLLNA